MNNLFKKEKAIELDANYSLETDKANGVVLVFQENRIREDDLTGVKLAYVFKETYFFPTLGQALAKYVDLAENECKDLKELILGSEEIRRILLDFRNRFKNWG